MDIHRAWPYVVVGGMLWLAVLQSGVHATIAGVVMGALVPTRPRKHKTAADPHGQETRFARMAALSSRLKNVFQPEAADTPTLGKSMIHAIHPWVAFVIMPLFAFANAGIPLAGLTIEHALNPLALGIGLGLLLGKPVGIAGTAWLLTRFGWARLPEGVRWLEFFGVCALAGIGFTMSLFIGELAFHHETSRLLHMKLGIIAGSLLAAVLGCLVLAAAICQSRKAPHAA